MSKQDFPRFSRLGASVLLLVPLLAFGCKKEVEEVVIAAPPVMVAPIVLRDVRDRIEATGQLLARSKANIAAQVGGEITVLHVDEGTEVEQSGVLLEIDPQRQRRGRLGSHGVSPVSQWGTAAQSAERTPGDVFRVHTIGLIGVRTC